MGELFRSLLDEFDFILIDCPPGLTLFSEAAIRAADGLVIPTLPNEISFAAIDHLRAEIARARPDRSFDDLLVGTVVSKVRHKNGSSSHRSHMESIERLLDRVAPQFQLLRPYLPYCRELEGATWRDDEGRDQLCQPLRAVVADDRAAGGGIYRQMRCADGAPDASHEAVRASYARHHHQDRPEDHRDRCWRRRRQRRQQHDRGGPGPTSSSWSPTPTCRRWRPRRRSCASSSART